MNSLATAAKVFSALPVFSMKEYRKCSDSGTVYDDPRVAVGPGVLTKLER
jgi:hypothetical protein